MTVPTREHQDVVKRMMVGDTYIARGSRQRNLLKSRFCNIYKVSQHGRSSFDSTSREYRISENQYGRSLDAEYSATAQECRTAVQTC